MPRSKSTAYLTLDEMSKLSTPRLLAYRRSLLELPDWRSGPDAVQWQQNHQRALNESKALLDQREHVERKL